MYLQKLAGSVALFFMLFLGVSGALSAVTVVNAGKPTARIVLDVRHADGSNDKVLQYAAQWLDEALQKSTGALLPIVDKPGDGPAIVIALAESYPQIASAAKLPPHNYDAYAIVTDKDRVYLLGNSASGAMNAVAGLLHQLGFRYYAPSPKWHIVPRQKAVTVDLNIVEIPALRERSIWYSYGVGGEKQLQEDFTKWARANRLSTVNVMHNGHSYGSIIGRNLAAFKKHPEYFALLANGQRDTKRPINARKFCVSNPGLVDLVVKDRIRQLEQYRVKNPWAFMVSVDPSDGQGVCQCDNCKALGTPTDRVFHLANAVAKALRAKYPDAWVGLYAYSSHRLPPTIKVEPNVYVQVAMGFNRTKYTLPQLVDMWSKKVGAIGLREYYGVEAWDWGLPGRMRGGRVEYLRKWIPYYYKRKLNAINAQTNANWGGQSLGLYVAAQLMWNPKVDVDHLVNEYFQLCFGKAAGPMRALQDEFDKAPLLRPATLRPMFDNVWKAYQQSDDPGVRARVVDMMAYLEYIDHFRDFDLVRSREPSRNDKYYDALRVLMQYAWRIRQRDVIHYYALARRLCNGLPVHDKRFDFYLGNKKQKPVWMTGEPLTDQQIIDGFTQQRKQLEAESNPQVAYSRYFDPVVHIKGEDVGPTHLANGSKGDGVLAFRHRLVGYLSASGPETIQFSVQPLKRSVHVAVYGPHGKLIAEQTVTEQGKFTPITVAFPRANDYRLELTANEALLKAGANVPLMIEASARYPAWIDMAGPMYFYVPRSATQVVVDGNPRLSVRVPGMKHRIDASPATREAGKQYTVIPVPKDAAGCVWHTVNQTRGQVILLNVPPLLSLHRNVMFLPREVVEGDHLPTGEAAGEP